MPVITQPPTRFGHHRDRPQPSQAGDRRLLGHDRGHRDKEERKAGRQRVMGLMLDQQEREHAGTDVEATEQPGRRQAPT